MTHISLLINRLLKTLGIILTRRVNVIPSERLSAVRNNIFRSLDIQLVFDIGANSGQWAKTVRRNGYSRLLISVEPTRNAFINLEKAAAQDSNWITLNHAIDTSKGSRTLQVSSNDGLSSSFFPLLKDHELAAPDVELINQEQVKTNPLESLIEAYSKERIYLKIDTQGSELLVLRSIDTDSFSKIAAIEVEISLVGTYEGGPLIEEVINYLRAKNFRPYRIENALARPNFGQQVQVDVVFVQEGIADLIA